MNPFPFIPSSGLSGMPAAPAFSIDDCKKKWIFLFRFFPGLCFGIEQAHSLTGLVVAIKFLCFVIEFGKIVDYDAMLKASQAAQEKTAEKVESESPSHGIHFSMPMFGFDYHLDAAMFPQLRNLDSACARILDEVGESRCPGLVSIETDRFKIRLDGEIEDKRSDKEFFSALDEITE